MASAHHLHDERLLDCYFAERLGDCIDPPAADHLVDCRACGVRYAELARFMDGMRAAADAETDAIFSPERLRAQQAQLAARLQQLAHPARVISFPARVDQSLSAATARFAPKWLAAAAAAGLFVGVGMGVFFEAGARSTLVPRPRATSAPFLTVVPMPSPSMPERAAPPDDDAFMSELELALDRPGTHELQPFDALTPHVRDVLNRVR